MAPPNSITKSPSARSDALAIIALLWAVLTFVHKLYKVYTSWRQQQRSALQPLATDGAAAVAEPLMTAMTEAINNAAGDA